MRSEPPARPSPARSRRTDTDLSTRARIRDAAIGRFARDGFDAPLRAIAADADVSAALVLHHFGSKDGLRRACDEYVFDVVRQAKSEALSPDEPGGGPMALFTQLAGVEDYAPVFEYTLRSLQAGGDLARSFVEHLNAVTLDYMLDGVANGTLRPSRDEPARARYLVSLSLGALLIEGSQRDPSSPRDPEADLRAYVDRVMLPALEVFTEGLLTSRRMLDEYLLYVGDPPGSGPPTATDTA